MLKIPFDPCLHASVNFVSAENIKICMPDLIPIVSSDIKDVSKDVQKKSTDVIEILLRCCGNNDLDVFIPAVLKGIKKPDTIYDSVESLASCIFVQNVESPALAVTFPILVKGLNWQVELKL